MLAEAEQLPVEHPDAVALRRATAGLFKTAKLQRRRERREAVLANDKAVTEATATGAPGRIDDETAGIPLRSTAEAPPSPACCSRPAAAMSASSATPWSTRSTTSSAPTAP